MTKVKYEIGKMKMEAEGSEVFVRSESGALLDFLKGTVGEKNTEISVPRNVASKIIHNDGVKEETVVIYDNVGIPSIMRKFSRITNAELFGGSDRPHPAFIIDSDVYDEIYISVYPNCEINGKPYSLPFMKPWTSITNDEAAKACFSKGDGWHLMTAAEWGLVANISLKNKTLPHGNTSYGKYHADNKEKGTTYGDSRTLTGSGPETWTHNHKPDGVHDLCGNVWEMVRGLRIVNGALQVAEGNNAAMDIDLAEDGEGWGSIKDDKGNQIFASVDDDNICFTTEKDIGQDCCGIEWEDVTIDCESEQLKELALYTGEPNTYCYVDSTDGEYFPVRGGCWSYGTGAGVFSADLYYPRSSSYTYIGFRSAYYKKH